MSENNTNVPKIRFPGFTDIWEQSRVGDYYDFKNGLNKGKEFFGHGVPIVNFTDVFHNRGINASKLKGKVDLQPSEIANYNVLEGDIFFTRTSETIDEIGYPSVMLDEPKDTVFSGFVLRGRAIGEDPLTLKFKQYVFYTDEFRKEMIKKSSMTTRALTSGTAIKQMEFHFPKDKREQDKIGDYFQELDVLITLHQRKLDHLQDEKKSLLQKMFPKNGADVPEFRFPGFTHAWEQRNITELGKIFIGLVTTMTENYCEEGTLLIRNSDIKENKFQFADNPIYLDEEFAEDSSTRRLYVGDVVTVHTGDIGTSAVITENEDGAIGFATINTRPNSEILDAEYLATFFNTEQHKHFAIKMSTGDGRSNYNLKDFNKVIIPLPSLVEQKKIGAFFKNIDHLITLHQRKLNHLQEQKKALLQQMFV